MKTLFVSLLLIASNSFAQSGWILSNSTVSGANWICTYRSPDGRFQRTVMMPTGQMCPSMM